MTCGVAVMGLAVALGSGAAAVSGLPLGQLTAAGAATGTGGGVQGASRPQAMPAPWADQPVDNEGSRDPLIKRALRSLTEPEPLEEEAIEDLAALGAREAAAAVPVSPEGRPALPVEAVQVATRPRVPAAATGGRVQGDGRGPAKGTDGQLRTEASGAGTAAGKTTAAARQPAVKRAARKAAPAAQKSAAKKSAAKKSAVKSAARMPAPAAKKPAAKKPAVKKAATAATAATKPATTTAKQAAAARARAVQAAKRVAKSAPHRAPGRGHR